MKIQIVKDSIYKFSFTPENAVDEKLLMSNVLQLNISESFLNRVLDARLLDGRYVGWDAYVQATLLGVIEVDDSIQPVLLSEPNRFKHVFSYKEKKFSFRLNKGYRCATSEESFICLVIYMLRYEIDDDMPKDEFINWVKDEVQKSGTTFSNTFPKIIIKNSEDKLERLQLLKKLVFISDSLQQLGHVHFDNYKININPYLYDYSKVANMLYAFKVLEISYEENEVYDGVPYPQEINVTFGSKVDLRVIYLITYILKEIYTEELIVYIIYASEPSGIENVINIGTFITHKDAYTNISKPISPYEILRIANIEQMEWEEFRLLFPNINYSNDCTCSCPEFEEEYEDDSYSKHDVSYNSYGGAYGFDDETIDNAFEGDPENYWNVD